MTVRFVTGHLSADPDVQQAGRVQITKFTVLENTYEYRGSERVDGKAPLAHYVEAKFELGENAATSLHKGDAVIVIGHERDRSFDGDDGIVYRRVIDASHIGPDLNRAIAAVTRRKPATPQPAAEPKAQPAPVEEEPWATPTPAAANPAMPDHGWED